MSVFECILLVCQIVVFNMLTTGLMSKLAYHQSLGKNKNWVKQNPKFIEEFPEPKPYLHIVLGILLLAALAYGIVSNNTGIVRMVKTVSLWSFLGQALLVDQLRSRQMKKRIPESTERKASLASRHLGTFIPKSITVFFTACYGALAAIAIYQFAFGYIRKIDFLLIVTPLVLAIVVGLPVLMWSIKRKPIVASENVAELYRKSEVFVSSLVLLTFLLIAIGQALVANFPGQIAFQETADGLQYLCAILPMGFFVWFCTNKHFKTIIHEKI